MNRIMLTKEQKALINLGSELSITSSAGKTYKWLPSIFVENRLTEEVEMVKLDSLPDDVKELIKKYISEEMAILR